MKEKYKLTILIIVMLFSNLITQAQFISFEHDGINRQYIYYEPSSLNENMPLVFVMHGFTGDANSIRSYSQMNQIADQYGFAVCYPKGIEDKYRNSHWDADLEISETDDVGFLSNLAKALQKTHGLNPNRTFVCGMSNGGYMSYYLS